MHCCIAVVVVVAVAVAVVVVRGAPVDRQQLAATGNQQATTSD